MAAVSEESTQVETRDARAGKDSDRGERRVDAFSERGRPFWLCKPGWARSRRTSCSHSVTRERAKGDAAVRGAAEGSTAGTRGVEVGPAAESGFDARVVSAPLSSFGSSATSRARATPNETTAATERSRARRPPSAATLIDAFR